VVLAADGTIQDRWTLEKAVVVDSSQEPLRHVFGSSLMSATWHPSDEGPGSKTAAGGIATA
jgi:hypothetical protein